MHRKALSKRLIKGRSITGLAAATVYSSYRKRGIPTSIKKIATLCNVTKAEIALYYRILVIELGMRMPVIDPISAIPRLASEVGIPEKTKRNALDIITKAKEGGIVAGKNPTGFAAAGIIYSMHI